jgi:hypothetical protein
MSAFSNKADMTFCSCHSQEIRTAQSTERSGRCVTVVCRPARSVGPLIGDPSGEHPIPNGANQEEPTVLGREEKQGTEVHNAEVAHG